jgi:RNA polymerase sigma-70 factor (ECF subfamily)
MHNVHKDLVTWLKSGEESAYRELYDRYYNILCIIAYQYVKDRFLSETFVNDVCYHLWEQRENIQINTSLRDYLVKSVKNRCVNYINHMKVVQKSAARLIDDYNRQQSYNEAFGDPLSRLITGELEESINKAMAALPPECREVFRLSRMEELSYVEIAGRLNISVNTVKYHIKNALMRIQEQLKKYLANTS